MTRLIFLLVTLLYFINLYVTNASAGAISQSQPFTLTPVNPEDVPVQFRADVERQAAAKKKALSKKSTIVYDDEMPSFDDEHLLPFASTSSSFTSVNKLSTATAVATNLLDDPEVNELSDGEPQEANITQHTYHFYKYVPSATNWPYTVQILVTPDFGDPDLFVRASSESSDTVLPNNTYYTWASTQSEGYAENVVIRPNDRNVCAPNITTNACTYYIAVYAWLATDYDVLVRTGNAVVEVSNGKTTYGSVRNDSYVYYFFENTRPSVDRTIAFAVTATFGSLEIYVDDVVEQPTSSNSKWRETAAGSNVIGLTQCTSQKYYIGVKGVNPYNSYTLLVHGYNAGDAEFTPTRLNPNVPMNDVLVFETYRYYYVFLDQRATAPYLSVLASKRVGETDIFVNYFNESQPVSAHFPTADTAQYSAIGDTGSHYINILNPSGGLYYIGVRAKSRNSEYSIVVSTVDSTTSALYMNQGYHYPGAVQQGNQTYYMFYGYTFGNNAETTIIVTSHSGYGYVLVGDKVQPQYRDGTTYNASAFTYDQSEIVLTTDNHLLHNGYYYITVYGYVNFSYSIAVISGNDITIQFEQEYNDFLSEESDRMYVLTVPYKNTDAIDFTVTVNSLYGFTHLFGGMFTDVSSSHYSYYSTAVGIGSQTIEVYKSACQNLASNETCTIYLNVVAQTDTSYNIASFPLNATVTLQRDEQMSGEVREGEYSLYAFNVDIDLVNVTVTVTPSTGDASLYISRSSYVSSNYHIFKSENAGRTAEVITFGYLSPEVRYAFTGIYYLAVYGVQNTKFKIKVTRTDPVPTQIFDGKPSYLYLTSKTYHFYSFTAPKAGYPYPLEFSVRPIYGDPDLYVHLKRNSSDVSPPNPQDWDTYDWSSMMGQNQVETVIIRPTSTPQCMPNVTGTTCTYYISVFAYSYTAFYLTARTGEEGTEVMNGVPTPNHYVSKDQYQYYFFYNDYPNQNRSIAFSVTAYFGEPEIYVDDVVESPTNDTARWRETALGSNVVGLTNCDSEFYYIGIKGVSQIFNLYSLLVHSYDPEHPEYSSTPLVLNQPQGDVLVFNTWRYYSLYFYYPSNENPSELSFLVSKRVGEPELYIRYTQYYNYEMFPNTTSYDWKSTNDGSNMVTIDDPRAGYYFVGVRAAGRNTQYQIAASAQITNSSSLQLIDGNLYPGYVRRRAYQYYSFTVFNRPYDFQELTFVVNPLHGSCNIYVSDTYTLPNRTNYNWTSWSTSNEMVVLTTANGRLHMGTYYLGVYGQSNCSYTVSASYTSRYSIGMGTTLVGYLQEEHEEFVMLIMPRDSAARDFTLTLSTEFGSAYLYVNMNQDPDRNNYRWGSDRPGVHTQTVKIGKEACQDVPTDQSCTFYILVFAPQETNYLLHAFYSNESQTIVSGQIVTKSDLRLDDYAFYKFNLAGDRMNVTIRVTPISGNPDLYLDRWDYVSADDYALSSETNGPEVIKFDWTTKETQYDNGMRGFWYIAVYARTACSFSLVVTAGNNVVGTITLVNGQPIVDDVVAQETRYYQFTLSPSNWPYDVSVSQNRILGYSTMQLITPDNTTISQSDINNRGLITVQSTDPNACDPTATSCLYQVRIGNNWGERVRFILTYSTSHLPTSLVSGVTTGTTSLAANKYDYYMITNAGDSNDVVLALNVMDGNPIMYVSTSEMFPSSEKNDWSTSSTNHIIGLTNQNASAYYMAVLAAKNGNSNVGAVYSVLPRTIDPKHPEYSLTYLEQGRPTISVVNALVYDYFVYYTYPDANKQTSDGFTVTITPKVGQPFIYMTSVTSGMDIVYPNATYCSVGDRCTNSTKDNGKIVIPKDQIPTEFTEYYIGVVSEVDAEYTITVMEKDGVTRISDGYKIVGSIESKQYHYYDYYIYTVRPDTDWSVSVTATTGSTEMYVNDDLNKPKKDNLTSFKWSSTFGVNVVRLTYNSGNIHQGYYSIGVYCQSSVTCDYNIIVSYSSVLTLSDGYAYQSELSAAGTRHLKFTVKGAEGVGNPDVALWELLLTTPVGTGQLYVGTDASNLPDYEDTSSWEWAAREPKPVQRLDFNENLCDNGMTCTYYVQLFCPTGCTYQIQAASQANSIQLVPGFPASGTVNIYYGIYAKIYRFNIPSEHDGVTLTLRMDSTSGMTTWPHMYVNLNSPSPSFNSSDFNSTEERRIQGIYFDANSLPKDKQMTGNCYVNVYYDASSSPLSAPLPYTLSLELGADVVETLLPGLEAVAILPAGGSKLFQFQFARTPSWPFEVYFRLRINSGASADMYVNVGGSSSPSANDYKWKLEGVSGSSELLTIAWSDEDACDPTTKVLCTYRVQVITKGGCTVRLIASIGENPPPDNGDDSGSGSNGGIIAAAVIIPLIAIVGGIALYYYYFRGRSCSWSSSSSKEEDFFGSGIEMNEAGARNSKKSKRGGTFNRLLDDADSEYARGGGDDGGSYRPPRL